MNRGILIQNTGINRGTSATNTGINRGGSAVNTGFYEGRKIQTSVHTHMHQFHPRTKQRIGGELSLRARKTTSSWKPRVYTGFLFKKCVQTMDWWFSF